MAPDDHDHDHHHADAADLGMIAELRAAFGVRVDERSAIVPRIEPLPKDATQPLARGPLDGGLAPGARLGDFEIVEELGRGGMGVVYRARQLSLAREVALKVLPGYAQRNPNALLRFQTEAQAASRLHHSHIVPIFAQGQADGHVFYAMALVEGVSLDRALHQTPELLSSAGGGSSAHARRLIPLTPPSLSTPAGPGDLEDAGAAVNWTAADYRHLARRMADIADAAAYAHARGVLHRDIKPHNLLVDRSGHYFLADFGLARLTDAPHLTVSGEIMGTPGYLSPEQVRGSTAEIDHRTDIYALGVTLYELLTGRKPFAGQTRAAIFQKILYVDPPAPRRINPRVPRDIETICLRALDKDARRRHPTADALAEDLRRFADGRPILSRRVGPIEQAGKWVRRHKAVTFAGAAAALAIALGVTLVAMRAAARASEADALARGAYEQLAFNDYRDERAVADRVARAAALGSDDLRLPLAQALAAMGRNKPDEARAVLEARSAADAAAASDARLQYLLAWVQRRAGAGDDAAATLAAAELRTQASADAMAPDAWFFRGLALHFDDAVAAADSYRRANAARARAGGFYPQALLHLARARNQQLYALRRLDGRDEAEASLKQLVEAGYYKAYPHYLLSISNRLAGEVHEGSIGTRADAAEQYYAQALRWARMGQHVDPRDDRPVAAEAECLERMGDFAGAVEARTRQLELADATSKRHEALHYRWRLHYWLGACDAARADLGAALTCDPGSRFYAYIYPALVEAERGDLSAALALARSLRTDEPASADALLWSASVLRLLGEADEADATLDAHARDVDPTLDLEPGVDPAWPSALLTAARSGDATEVDALAAGAPRPWRLTAQVALHRGIHRLGQADRAAAENLLLDAYRSFDGEQACTYHARTLLVQMQKNRDWPAWLGVTSGTVSESSPGLRLNPHGKESP